VSRTARNSDGSGGFLDPIAVEVAQQHPRALGREPRRRGSPDAAA
jgi:hypothetical protein